MIEKIKKYLTENRTRAIMILTFTFFLVKGLAWIALLFISYNIGVNAFLYDIIDK